MNRYKGIWITRIVVVIGLIGVRGEVAAEAFVPVTIFLQTPRPEQRGDAEVIRAQDEVTRIYSQIGVAVRWLDAKQARTARVIVTIVFDEAVYRVSLKLDAAPASSLGLALRSKEGPNRLAFVLYSRIASVAERRKVERSSVLAIVMAHEIAHLLLPGSSHSAAGLMRGFWDGEDFSNAASGELRFSAREADLIRSGLASGQQACSELGEAESFGDLPSDCPQPCVSDWQ